MKNQLANINHQSTQLEIRINNSPKEIYSLTEYHSWVKEVCQEDLSQDYTLFYRGHSDFEYKLEPTVYRSNEGKTFRSVEHHLYSEMLRHSTSDFLEDKTTFERLVRMQHYGLPTRLMDLTLNPLIALYFSCREKNETTGEVILFKRNNNQFCYSSGIPETALVGIENPFDMEDLCSQILYHLTENLDTHKKFISVDTEFNEKFIELIGKYIDILRNSIHGNDDILIIASKIKSFYEGMKSFFSSEIEFCEEIRRDLVNPVEERLKTSEKQLLIMKEKESLFKSIEKLVEIFSELVGIKNKIKFFDEFILQFTHYTFVLPFVNNERIRRQQGAFLVFPPGSSIHWTLDQFLRETKRIRINAGAKKEILKELAVFGISESYIFPELNVLASDIKLRHPAR